MLRSRGAALPALQKTYDESYLTCSTAVYYESQGNEGEAMRCWRSALEQISDHHANKVLPNYTPRSETERALIDSLRQLELQCKERIDLLEALRLSRQEGSSQQQQQQQQQQQRPASFSGTDSNSNAVVHPSSPSDILDTRLQQRRENRGWIGDGTIPAITYTQLSRPELPRRPPMSIRSSSEQIAVAAAAATSSSSTPDALEFPPSSSSSRPPPLPSPASLLTPEIRPSRPPSPERHTMRTTLRPSRVADKSSKISSSGRHAAPKPADRPGASKAATLAWSALGLREKKTSGTQQPRSAPTTTAVESRSLSEQGRRSMWDSHSRRLVTPLSGHTDAEIQDSKRPVLDLGGVRYVEDTTSARLSQSGYFPPSSLSVSAASSALTSQTIKDSAERFSLDSDRLPRPKTNPFSAAAARLTGDRTDAFPGEGRDQAATAARRKSSSDVLLSPGKRKPASSQGGVSLAPAAESNGTRRRNPCPGDSARSRVQKPQRSTGPPGIARQPSISDGDESSQNAGANSSRRTRGKTHRSSSLRASVDSPSVQSVEEGSAAEEDAEESRQEGQEGDEAVVSSWKKRKARVLKNLPPGVDTHAAKQILNEIVVQGDEVHWSDIAGLEIAKNALRETVVYPFLRPDLFRGLREPAKGMLLFGPPGTGKTMLARAVATESASTFFSISASSLTSKYLGESEKLVRALFALARLLAPSIIFVDEIDSLLSQRSGGSGEHEASRRVKTEFLIQWSDLQRAAAGRETDGDKDRDKDGVRSGDANRVLVLAATNLPWAIDEAARRRFVRRQYIPLPEAETRATQLRTLLGQQKHGLTEADIARLVEMTDGFSGSDITALAKDAAMGPLRSLGEALLRTTMDEIRPIEFADFAASLATIRPSVSKAGLREYDEWARQFGERGG